MNQKVKMASVMIVLALMAVVIVSGCVETNVDQDNNNQTVDNQSENDTPENESNEPPMPEGNSSDSIPNFP